MDTAGNDGKSRLSDSIIGHTGPKVSFGSPLKGTPNDKKSIPLLKVTSCYRDLTQESSLPIPTACHTERSIIRNHNDHLIRGSFNADY